MNLMKGQLRRHLSRGFLGLAFVPLLLLACKSSDPDVRARSSTPAANARAAASSCPMCDEELAGAWSADVDGTRVRVCSVLCLNKFQHLSDVEKQSMAQQHGR